MSKVQDYDVKKGRVDKPKKSKGASKTPKASYHQSRPNKARRDYIKANRETWCDIIIRLIGEAEKCSYTVTVKPGYKREYWECLVFDGEIAYDERHYLTAKHSDPMKAMVIAALALDDLDGMLPMSAERTSEEYDW